MNEQESKNIFRKNEIIRCVCFLLVLALTFTLVQNVLTGKWYLENSMQANTKWYRELKDLRDDSVDVFFCGTSHTYASCDPMYMYENTGITGYVLAAGGLHLDLEYLYLKDALKNQHPKYVLLDMSAIRYKGQHVETMLHRTLDRLPVTRDKIDYILANKEADLTLLNCIFPFFRYHDRWAELTELDFVDMTGDYDKSPVRGHGFGYKVVTAKMDYAKEKEDFEVLPNVKQQLQDLVDLCRENNTIPVFFKTASPDWTAQFSAAAQALADEMGTEYFDLASPEAFAEMGMDLESDFRDSNNHVNQSGAEKNSAYLANYLVEKYGLEDHRSEYADWDKDLEKYNKFKKKTAEEKDLSE